MNKPWKLILLLVGIFIAGSVTGALVMQRIGRASSAKRPLPEQWAPLHLKRLVDRLDLQPEQVDQLRPIVRRNMEQLNRLRAFSLAETRSGVEQMEREIADKLSPEQRAKFERMNKEMRERAKRLGHDRLPGGPNAPRPERPRPPGGAPLPPGEGPAPEKPTHN
jgi:uncharacterized membrane protein